MIKLFLRIAAICLACGIFSGVQAEEMANADTNKADSFKLSFAPTWDEEYHIPHLYAFSIGPVFSSDVGETQNFPIQNPIADSFYNYQKTNQVQTNGQFALFVGDRWNLRFPFKVEGGLSYSQTGIFSTKGLLTQGADVLSEDTFTYKYKIQSRQLEVKGKILYGYPGPIFPYFSFGMGAAFNTANNFSTNVPEFLTTTRNYPSNTQASFTYTVGIGAEYEYDSHIHLGWGYEFSNNGSVAFESANVTGIPVTGTITQSHLYTHAIMAQVSYLIDNRYHSTLKQLTDWS
jgi:opacity protein-like surface antigen